MDIFENLSASSRSGQDALDAYSRAVREVTERLEPAVISVGLRDGRGGGGGGGVGGGGGALVRGGEEGPATAVTNAHVVRGLGGGGGGRGNPAGIEVTL